jgi:hypothetical protein
MKNGAFDEGEATLRLKLTLEDSKQDPVSKSTLQLSIQIRIERSNIDLRLPTESSFCPITEPGTNGTTSFYLPFIMAR